MDVLTLHPPAHRIKTEIFIGEKASEQLPELLEKMKADGIVVLCDKAVKGIAEKILHHRGHGRGQRARSEANYSSIRAPSMGAVVGTKIITVASGDASKSLCEIERLAQKLLALGASRQTVLVNVGGGMLTDLGGFLGSIFMRGIRFVHVPTTLLGMVDAAVGGKTGVNLGTTKNMIGTTAHPVAIVCDTDFLQKLPDAQLREGLVEIIKIAAMLDEKFFHWLEKNVQKICAKDSELLAQCVKRAVELKVNVVEEDERDTSVRLHLNFGHTVGHAVEALSKFSLSHGQAVSIGMAAELAMSGSSVLRSVISLLQALKMPTEIPSSLSDESKLWKVMLRDKKNVSGQVRIAVPEKLGDPRIHSISRSDFSRLFA